MRRRHVAWSLVLPLALAACKTPGPAVPPVVTPPAPPPVAVVTPVTPPPPMPPPRVYGSQALLNELGALLKEPYSDTQTVDVLYATNRMPGSDQSECDDKAFGLNPTGRSSYGICRINVPKRHGVGGFELAPNPRADTHRYFRVLGHIPLDDAGVRSYVEHRKPSDVLLFVHGFNVLFQEAVLRSAQIAYDLKFQGPVVLYTWPAGSGGLVDSAIISRTYEANRANAQVSAGRLAVLLKALAASDVTVHVLAHSMGHQVVLPAIARVAAETGKPFIGELILNAPDFPLKEFAKVLPSLRRLSQRITLYCSYNDNAIAASEVWNKGRRMGACEQMDGVDVINVGEIDAPSLGIGGLGHGYYAGRPILTDVYQVLLGIPADRRLFIRKSEPGSTENYYLRP